MLTVSGVSKAYLGRNVLNDVSLDVRRGEIVGIVGPNGAGKTTLFECIQGLVPLDGGSIHLLGQAVKGRLPYAVKRRIGVTPQFFALPPALTVIEIARMYSVLYDRSIGAEAALEATNLSAQAEIRFGRLSGGQKRRLALSLALLGDPDFLFLDEPTGDLDPQSRRFIWDRIRDVSVRHRRTVLLATHQMDEVEALCERVILLDEGCIREHDAPDSLIARYCPGHQVRFVTETIYAARWVERLPGARVTAHAVQEDRTIVRWFVDDPGQALPRLFSAAADLDGRVLDMQVSKSSLEDVFITLTGRALRE